MLNIIFVFVVNRVTNAHLLLNKPWNKIIFSSKCQNKYAVYTGIYMRIH